MINYFRKIHHFEIEGQKLYDEWFEIGSKYNMFDRTKSFHDKNAPFHLPNYYRLIITYSSIKGPDCDPVWISNHNDRLQPGEYETFNIGNIHNAFKGTYTEQVAKTVSDYLISKNITPTVIKYAVLHPNSSFTTHNDRNPIPRYFLSVSAPKGCFMEVCDELHPLDDTGALFRMVCSVPHNPINRSNGYRVMMTFDAIPPKN